MSLRWLLLAALMTHVLTEELPAQPISSTKKPVAAHTAQFYLDQGRKQFEQKRFAIAVRTLSTAIRRDNNLAEAYRLRGEAFDQMGLPQKAVHDFTQYIRLRPSDPKGYIYRADAHNFNLEHQAAIEDYSHAIRLAKSSASAYVGRGLAYAGLGKYGEAVKDYQQALRINPDSTEVLANLGVACMLAGRSLEAMNYFERALKKETDPKWKEQIERWIAQLLQESKVSKPGKDTPRRGPVGSPKPMW
ncbi:MAG: tetratricopeptide repeat protein [Desulfomonile tiedjei]|nr:tetratricopeptide repeat protein [Desulfomonile tiedjei]